MIVLYMFTSFQTGVEFRLEAEVSPDEIQAFEEHTRGNVTKLYCIEEPPAARQEHTNGDVRHVSKTGTALQSHQLDGQGWKR